MNRKTVSPHRLCCRLATSVCQASHTQASLGPTEPCNGCNRFLLSSGCEWGEYYQVAHSTGLIPNENQISCRTLVACLESCGARTQSCVTGGNYNSVNMGTRFSGASGSCWPSCKPSPPPPPGYCSLPPLLLCSVHVCPRVRVRVCARPAQPVCAVGSPAAHTRYGGVA